MQAADVIARPAAAAPVGEAARPRFLFARDSFAFANELFWAYQVDAATGRMTFSRREPRPQYAHRCFVLTRAARQFFYHAEFDATMAAVDEQTYRCKIRAVVSRSPRVPCPVEDRVKIPGFGGLRDFSHAWEALLKAECGGAWRSYVLRSHWRMIFPISRSLQARTAAQLAAVLDRGVPPVIHLVRFPKLTINHGMILTGCTATAAGLCFDAYDPNDPQAPTTVSFDAAARTFSLPANAYWAGGPLDVIEIYRNWFL